MDIFAPKLPNLSFFLLSRSIHFSAMSSEAGSYPTDLLSSYSASGFASSARSLPFGQKPALLVIDVCNAYLTPGSPLYAPERFHNALASTNDLISRCRQHKIPVVFTRVVYPSPESGGNWYKHKLPGALPCFDVGNELGDYPTGNSICRPQKGEMVIEKQFSSAFFGTSLASQLVAMKTDTLIICGYSTSGCVRATTTDAMQYGFNPYVVKEACGDRHAYPHDANLFDIQAKFGEVVSMEEIKELTRR